jgi:hypothetical protein
VRDRLGNVPPKQGAFDKAIIYYHEVAATSTLMLVAKLVEECEWDR